MSFSADREKTKLPAMPGCSRFRDNVTKRMGAFPAFLSFIQGVQQGLVLRFFLFQEPKSGLHRFTR